jgi:hypothetical protein
MLDNPGVRLTISVGLGVLLLGIILWLLPPIPLPYEVTEAVTWIFTTLWAFDFMIPVQTLVTGLGIILLVDIIFASKSLVLFFARVFTRPV